MKKNTKLDETKNLLAVSSEKKVEKKLSREEAKDMVMKSAIVIGDIDNTLDQLTELLPKWKDVDLKKDPKAKEEFDKKVSATMYGFESETHVALMESFNERFRGSAKVICKQFIKDLDCKNDFEKLLAESATMAFMRYMDASRRLNNCFDVDNLITPNKTAYMAMLSKERDRAHRQYLSTIATIKQLKSPTIEMNIRTKNAFVAQNQQINADYPPKTTNNENNDAK